MRELQCQLTIYNRLTLWKHFRHVLLLLTMQTSSIVLILSLWFPGHLLFYCVQGLQSRRWDKWNNLGSMLVQSLYYATNDFQYVLFVADIIPNFMIILSVDGWSYYSGIANSTAEIITSLSVRFGFLQSIAKCSYTFLRPSTGKQKQLYAKRFSTQWKIFHSESLPKSCTKAGGSAIKVNLHAPPSNWTQKIWRTLSHALCSLTRF